MAKLLIFNKIYFFLTILLFGIELLIAKYAHDRIIRPYIGDLLVVILLYCLVKSFLNTAVFPTAIAVLAFSFIVETLQYFDIVNRLGLRHSSFARIIIGTSFAWMDLLFYALGIAIVLHLEQVFASKKSGNEGPTPN